MSETRVRLPLDPLFRQIRGHRLAGRTRGWQSRNEGSNPSVSTYRNTGSSERSGPCLASTRIGARLPSGPLGDCHSHDAHTLNCWFESSFPRPLGKSSNGKTTVYQTVKIGRKTVHHALGSHPNLRWLSLKVRPSLGKGAQAGSIPAASSARASSKGRALVFQTRDGSSILPVRSTCGCSSKVERRIPNAMERVRFPSSALMKL